MTNLSRRKAGDPWKRKQFCGACGADTTHRREPGRLWRIVFGRIPSRDRGGYGSWGILTWVMAAIVVVPTACIGIILIHFFSIFLEALVLWIGLAVCPPQWRCKQCKAVVPPKDPI